MYIHSFLIKSSHSRFKQYYNRWANHEQSAKLALDLYVKTEKKMEEMKIASALTWIEVQFMKKAVDELDKCRMTLKWTYAMAYYLANGNGKDVFEDNQRSVFYLIPFSGFFTDKFVNNNRDLERAVEDLSELLESRIEAGDIPTLRQRVMNMTVCFPFLIPQVPFLTYIYLGLCTQTKRDFIRRHRSEIFARYMDLERRRRWV